MVGHPKSDTCRDKSSMPFLKFLQRFDGIFRQTHRPIDWKRYGEAIGEKWDPRFRGPDFLSISPARSATTWLFQQLRRNPSVCLPDIKETNYFASGWLDGPYEKYIESWQPHQLTGDISPINYSLPRQAIRAVHEVYPQMRLICILRNPVERLWSQILFDLTQAGGGVGASLPEIAALSEKEFLALAAFYCGANYYAAFLERWLESYSPDQIFVDFFDTVSDAPESLLARICRFLRIEDHGVVVRGKVNAFRYGPLVMPTCVKEFLRDFYAPELDRLNRVLKEHFGSAVPRSWYVAGPLCGGSTRILENYRGLDVFYRDHEFCAVRHGKSAERDSARSRHFWQVLPGCDLSLEENLETLIACLCENRDSTDGPKLVTSYQNYNLVTFRGQAYALPHSLGVWEKWYTEDPAAVPGILVGATVSDLKGALDKTCAENQALPV